MFIQQKLYKALFIVSLVFLIIGTGLGLVGETAEINIEINNPYEDVNWENFEQYKSNLHTHTTESDGDSDPAEVIDGYHQLDYSILALTDHNNVTWTWESFDRDPEELGMIAIQANELSDTHHIGSFFNDYDEITSDEEKALKEVEERDGLAVFYHPGRYDYEKEWYIDFYDEYEHLIGLEVYNQGDRYSDDRIFWDTILTSLMPERPVWGFSNDDMHNIDSHLGRNINIFVLEELSKENIRESMVNGEFYFAYVFETGDSFPEIKEVEVDNDKIKITANHYDEIIWKSSYYSEEARENQETFKEIAREAFIEAKNLDEEDTEDYFPYHDENYSTLAQGEWEELDYENIEEALYDYCYMIAKDLLPEEQDEKNGVNKIINYFQDSGLEDKYPVGVETSKKVGNGKSIDFEKIKDYPYVRAEIESETGITYTQPFGVKKD